MYIICFNIGCNSIKSKINRKYKRLRVSNEIFILWSVVEILVMLLYLQDIVQFNLIDLIVFFKLYDLVFEIFIFEDINIIVVIYKKCCNNLIIL